MSGTSYGAVVLHVAPESAVGGPLALVRGRRPDPARRRGAAPRPARRRGRARARRREPGRRPSGRTTAATGGCTRTTSSRRTRAATSTSCAAARRSSRRRHLPLETNDEGARHRRARKGRPGARPGARCGPGTTCGRRDLTRPDWDRLVDPRAGEDYWQADLTDAGACYALARGCDAVVHTAAIPQPIHNAPHVVFANNLHGDVQRARGGDRRGRAPVRELLQRDGARASSSPTVPSSRTTCRSTRSIRSGRRTPTRPRSGSASC